MIGCDDYPEQSGRDCWRFVLIVLPVVSCFGDLDKFIACRPTSTDPRCIVDAAADGGEHPDALCGAVGAPCCTNSSCEPGSICGGGVCQPCGRAGEACCTSGACVWAVGKSGSNSVGVHWAGWGGTRTTFMISGSSALSALWGVAR